MITIHQRYRQTDRQLFMAIPRYATLRAVKMNKKKHSEIVNLQQTAILSFIRSHIFHAKITSESSVIPDFQIL